MEGAMQKDVFERGVTIGEVVGHALALANSSQGAVTFTFNSVQLVVNPGDEAGRVYDSYFVSRKRQAAE